MTFEERFELEYKKLQALKKFRRVAPPARLATIERLEVMMEEAAKTGFVNG